MLAVQSRNLKRRNRTRRRRAVVLLHATVLACRPSHPARKRTMARILGINMAMTKPR
jgi:hypothetical protein